MKTEVLDFGPRGIVLKDTITPAAKKGPNVVAYRPVVDNGERPRLYLPGICETKEAFAKIAIISALNGVPSASFDQPRRYRPMLPHMAKDLRVNSALSAIETTNGAFDNRGVVARPHSLGGVDFAYASPHIDADEVPEVDMLGVAGLRKNSAIKLAVNAQYGMAREAMDLGVCEGSKSFARLMKGGLSQLSAEGMYAMMSHTEELVRVMGKRGMQTNIVWFEDDALIPMETNIGIEDENVKTFMIRSSLGARACHNMPSCSPVVAYRELELITGGDTPPSSPIPMMRQEPTYAHSA